MVPNWDRLQHYKDRVPDWIKLYTAELAHNPDWESLSAGSRGTLVTIWVEYALSKGQLRCEVVSKSLGRSYKVAYLDSLNNAGFIQLSASKPLALTRSRERSTEKEKKVARPRSRVRATVAPSEEKLSRYAMAEAMTRNVGRQYTPASFQEELDRFDLTDNERDLLNELRSSLNGTTNDNEDELF